MNYPIPLKKLINKLLEKDEKSLQSRLVHGIFWNFISVLAAQGFPLIAAIITARLLGTAGYGQMGMINSTVILFSTFAGLGLGVTATKYIAQYHLTDPERTGRIMGLTYVFGIVSGLVMFLILFIMAPWLAANTLSDPGLAPVLRIASLLLIFNTIVGIESGTIAGFGAFKDLAKIAIIQGIISACLTLTGVYFFGLTGAIVAMVINSIINVTLYKVSINNLVKRFKIKVDYLKSWKEREVIVKLSLPTMLSSVMVGPVVWIANIIIINNPGGYSQLGLFNAADQWRMMLAFLPTVIGGVLLPMVSAAVHKENKSLETVNVLASWIIVIIIALPLISFPEIIALFYGQEYYSSTIFLQSISAMMLVSCILAYKEGIARKLIAKNLMWWGFLSNLVWGLIFIVSILLFQNLGALGLAISYIISYSLNTLIFVPFYISRRVVPKNLLISWEVILIWLVLIIQTILALSHVNLWIRSLGLIIAIGIMVFSFYRILKPTNWRR
ncbi:oligosaccharide flippase family protein [Methanobacterium petrolearium]|uniref:oligosaccharide flippase family protein n=2 Tax=Methanobacterium petrolearium TaxID=710190 RepID=UPI001AE279CC|nr:oligosaccharide flippase family protein [Methanobacterium petrolearium]MBP1945458.1 O-antigen/teichoic acid export membrane protein [Methanobacterium petrolearium]